MSASSSRRDDVMHAPQAEVLGTVTPTVTTPGPQAPRGALWTDAEGRHIDLQEAPPPWELEDRRFDASDARRFVEVPDNWVLRWVNPRLLDQLGWQYWQPVMASDERVTVKVRSMVSVSNNIRRGGETGDILAWMYQSWVDSRRRERQARVDALTQSAVDRQEQVKDEVRRGEFGRYVSITGATHPTHTIGEGKSMREG